MTSGGSYQAVILTAIPVEYEAVRAHLANFRQEMHPSGTIYERGNFTANNQSWDVLIGETGIGNTRAAVETVRVIEYFKPSLILFIGVAGGLKDVKLGDVVAATKVYGYESGKAGRKFRPRPDVRNSTHRMEQRARAESKRREWFQRLETTFPDPTSIPRVHVAPIASGNQVAASMDSALGNLLRLHYSDAVAVEMEGYGFLEALRAYPQIDALIVRGISDMVDNKTEADAKHYQEVAARHAAAFSFEVLAKLDVDVLQPDGLVSSGQQQVSQSTQYQTVRLEERQVLQPAATAESLLQEFRAALPGYKSQIERIRAYFDETGYIIPHRYRKFMESLDSIGRHVQMLCKHASKLNIYDSARLFTIRDQIRALRLELQKFRPTFQPIEPSRQRREDGRSREAISAKCKALISNLERF